MFKDLRVLFPAQTKSFKNPRRVLQFAKSSKNGSTEIGSGRRSHRGRRVPIPRAPKIVPRKNSVQIIDRIAIPTKIG